MNILIINPDSSDTMTEAIQGAAEQYAGGDFSVKTVSTPGAPPFIETYEDQLKAAPGMMQPVRQYESEYDAFIIAAGLAK